MKKELQQLTDELKKKGIATELCDDMLHVKDEAGNAEAVIKGVGKSLGIEYQIDRKKCGPSCPICRGENPIVRVAGFSAYFMDMHKEVQDQIIARTKQRLA
jgi:predicted GNAT family acetyltransferase